MITFADVPAGSTFYSNVRCLACQGIVGGYPCGGPGEPCNATNNPYFRPNTNVTRGQIAKIVALSADLPAPNQGQTFEDVPPGSTFWQYAEALVAINVMGGYTCGGAGEPCVPPANRPYFRPNTFATRGQLAKIVSNTAGFEEEPGPQLFEDVSPANAFSDYIYRLSIRGVVGGYPCGGVNPQMGEREPCISPENRPYFRPNNSVTRGQTSKIVSLTFFPGCDPRATR